MTPFAGAAEPPPPSRVADTFPLVSEFTRADMDYAIHLLSEEVSLAAQEKDVKEARTALKSELGALAAKYGVPGMRWGQVACYYGGMKRRKNLDKKKLIEYITVEELEACYTLGKEYLDVRVRDLSKKDDEDKED